MTHATGSRGIYGLPDWVPMAEQHYLFHTETGFSIRAPARIANCHASTILRQVRRYEQRRDDPLIDDALHKLDAEHLDRTRIETRRDGTPMTIEFKAAELKTGHNKSQKHCPILLTDKRLDHDMLRVLKRLLETGAVLAVVREMDKAVVVRDGPSGQSTRTAIVDRVVAETLALKDWITCRTLDDPNARISRDNITSQGRAALKKLINKDRETNGMAEAPAVFDGKPVGLVSSPTTKSETRRMRYNLGESPLTGLSRRREKDGRPFLRDELVTAGARLREDFELAQMGENQPGDWDQYLVASDADRIEPELGAAGARDRFQLALADLGRGLGDVILRCCCFLEWLETAERELGWSARSGKIVLRIALERLRRHFEERYGKHGPLIG